MKPGEFAMAITLELEPEIEQEVFARAKAEGMSPERYLTLVISTQLGSRLPDEPALDATEAQLLQEIRKTLPEATWDRYKALKQKRDAEALTSDEHVELLRLVREVEEWNVRRLTLAAALAELRGVPFREIVRQLGLAAPENA
jgi:hypothetical protein